MQKESRISYICVCVLIYYNIYIRSKIISAQWFMTLLPKTILWLHKTQLIVNIAAQLRISIYYEHLKIGRCNICALCNQYFSSRWFFELGGKKKISLFACFSFHGCWNCVLSLLFYTWMTWVRVHTRHVRFAALTSLGMYGNCEPFHSFSCGNKTTLCNAHKYHIMPLAFSGYKMHYAIVSK